MLRVASLFQSKLFLYDSLFNGRFGDFFAVAHCRSVLYHKVTHGLLLWALARNPQSNWVFCANLHWHVVQA